MKNVKKIIIITAALLLPLLVKLAWAYKINENFIARYNNSIYQEEDIKDLFFLNLTEPCVAYYNKGNIHYKNEDFDVAIEEYLKALEHNPSERQEISIRINLALAKLGELQKDTPQEIDRILEQLKNARTGLYENEISHEFDDNGKSAEAEKLEQEIREMEESLSKETESKSEQSDEPEPDDEIKEKFEQQRQQSQLERTESLDIAERIWEDFEYYPGKNW